MKIWQILNSLGRLEEEMARLYDAARLHYAVDPGIAGFFAQMRDEELSHRDIVRYQQRLLYKAPESYLELRDYDQAGLEQTLRTVEDLVAREPGLALDEVLHSVINLESAATEQHYRSVIGQASPTLGNLVRQLGDCDQAHAAKLARFARAHGVEPVVHQAA